MKKFLTLSVRLINLVIILMINHRKVKKKEIDRAIFLRVHPWYTNMAAGK